MKQSRFFIHILLLFVTLTTLTASCGENLKHYQDYGISFDVSKDLQLHEYYVDFATGIFRIGKPSFKQGAIISLENNFTLLWLTPVPSFSKEEIEEAILSSGDAFYSTGGTFNTVVSTNIISDTINGFSVSYASMELSSPGWNAPGITAIWECPTTQRIFQLIVIHNKPMDEMKRIIRSFASSKD